MNSNSPQERPLTRRDFMRASAAAAGMSLLGPSALHANPLAPMGPPLPGKAKRVIFLFMFGGPSQMDLFDYKPELQKHAGQSTTHERRTGKNIESTILGSERKFKQYGETGQWCSDALPAAVPSTWTSSRSSRASTQTPLRTDRRSYSSTVARSCRGIPRSAHGPTTVWGPRIRSCRALSSCTIRVAVRSLARPTGAAVTCRRSSRAPCSARRATRCSTSSPRRTPFDMA